MFKKLRFKSPISCKEKIIIIIPAIILKLLEFCNNKFPIKEAVAPKLIKTRENPTVNKIVFKTTFLNFFSRDL